MTLDELTISVAKLFKSYMIRQGFDSFNDMKQKYRWTDSDIRSEIEYAAIISIKDDYSKFLDLGGDAKDYNRILIFDDCSVSDSSSDMSYSNFRRAILAKLARM